MHAHRKASQPMGIHCALKVKDGALAGAAIVYNRKIRELAARADMQRELSRRKDLSSPPTEMGTVSTAGH